MVDDDYLQRTLLKLRLEHYGFEVSTACGAAEALRMVATARPDAIVSDVLMDELDGFSLCRILRGDATLSKVPIVLVSAYFDEVADTALAREVGADALVCRSGTFQECIDVLVRSLHEHRPAAAPPQAASNLYVQRVAHQLVRLRQGTIRAQARYQALFEHASDAVSVLTPAGIVVDVNRRWEEIMQRPRDELVGLHIRDFTHPRNAEQNQEGFQRAVARGDGRDGPVPITRRDGTTILMEFTTAKFAIEGSETVLAIGRDVTEVVEAQRKLEASERQYRTLIENIPEVVWSLDGSGRVRFISPNVLEMCGFTAQQIMDGKQGGTFARVHPEDYPQMRDAVAAVIARQTTLMEVECRWQHRDGRWLWLHYRGRAAVDENGAPCIDGVCFDVTTRKQLEEQLAQSQKLETIGQLTAGIAHDFNNILAVIVANAEYLVQKQPDRETRDIAGEITSAAQRGIDLTRGLLGFARRETAEPRELDLNAVLAAVERMLVCTLGRNIVLRVSPGNGLGLIRADARQIEQVLMNLTVNARDAMAGGGSLSIQTANVDVSMADAGHNGLPGPGRYVAIALKDTGSGMSPEVRDRIFEPFFTTKGERGTGLGLSTSYGIVRRYGGHVAIDSAPRGGTTFTLYFPRIERGA